MACDCGGVLLCDELPENYPVLSDRRLEPLASLDVCYLYPFCAIWHVFGKDNARENIGKNLYAIMPRFLGAVRGLADL